MNYILAKLLLNLADEEEAFWLLATVVEDLVPGCIPPALLPDHYTHLPTSLIKCTPPHHCATALNGMFGTQILFIGHD